MEALGCKIGAYIKTVGFQHCVLILVGRQIRNQASGQSITHKVSHHTDNHLKGNR